MNICLIAETFWTCETVKNTKSVQNNGIFPDLLPNLSPAVAHPLILII